MRIYWTTLAVITLFVAPLRVSAGDDADFESKLSPEQEVTGDPGEEVPAEVVSDASGRAKLEFAKDLSSAEIDIKLRDASGVTAAHIHCGRAGVNGPVVVVLYGGDPLEVDGRFLELEIINEDIIPTNCAEDGPRISNVAALAAAAADGLLYINVHTIANPPGEIRGQLLKD